MTQTIAIVEPDGSAVVEIRTIGDNTNYFSTPNAGKRYGLPLVEAKPILGLSEAYDGYSDVINPAEVVRTWKVRNTLAEDKARLKTQLDEVAEQMRQRFVTPGHGQAMVYREKWNEVQRFKNDPSPTNARYPLMAAEIGLTGADLATVQATMEARGNFWIPIAAQIERIRLQGKAAIDAAADSVAAQAAYDAVDWSAIPNP